MDTPLNPPLTLASNFHGGKYAREQGSPAWDPLEEALGEMEGGRCVTYASGMAAVTAVIESLPPAARVVGPSSGYAWTRGLLRERASQGRISLHEVDTTDTDAALAAAAGADLLWLESPSNPLIRVTELDRICAQLKDREVRVAVDSTFATPLLQRPLELGADFSMQSATKFIGGHSDLMLGAVSTRDDAGYDGLLQVRGRLGATPGALEAYLALRGLRTLPVRMSVAQANAQEIAQRLDEHPAVAVVNYPGLATDPGHHRAARFMDGFGAMVSFELDGSADAAEELCRNVTVFTHAKSLGGVESLIDRRARYEGSSAPATLLRLSIGCEHVEDLWADLSGALDGVSAARHRAASGSGSGDTGAAAEHSPSRRDRGRRES